MAINIRTKGARAERDIADDLNAIVYREMERAGQLPILNSIQRNQQQTAVGGSDLIGTFGVAIEVKRQETLSLNTWWKQCTKAAERNKEIPVLLYKQNRKAWKCVMPVDLMHTYATDTTYSSHTCRAELEYEDFLIWFTRRVDRLLTIGHIVKV